MRKPVFMCVCHNLTFEQILQISRQRQMESLDELQQAKICGTNCQMCVPYIKKMLQTGETSFNPGDCYLHTG